MNWIDYIIISLLGLSIFVGLWRGLMSELLALVTWIIAILLTWMLAPTVAEYLGQSIKQPVLKMVSGAGLCFMTVMVSGTLLRRFICRLVQNIGLGGMDRCLGMLFGFIRGLVLVIMTVSLLGLTPLHRQIGWKQSCLLPAFQDGVMWLSRKMPPMRGWLSGNSHKWFASGRQSFRHQKVRDNLASAVSTPVQALNQPDHPLLGHLQFRNVS